MNNQNTPPPSPKIKAKQLTPEFKRVIKDMREQRLDDKQETKYIKNDRKLKLRNNAG